MVEANRDRVGADRAPFARGAAGAEVVDADIIFDDETSAVRGGAFLNDPFQHRGRPVRTEDLVASEEGARMLHRFPTGDFGEELV